MHVFSALRCLSPAKILPIVFLCMLFTVTTSRADSLLCGACSSLIAKTIEAELQGGVNSCKSLAVDFATECVVEAGGPEDILGVMVCGVADAAVVETCGQSWGAFKEDVSASAKAVCSNIGFCSSSPPVYTAKSTNPTASDGWAKYPALLPSFIQAGVEDISGASAVEFRGKQYVFTSDTQNKGMYISVAGSENPILINSWGSGSSQLPTQGTTYSEPMPVVYHDWLYLIFTGTDNHIYILGTQTPMIPNSWEGYPGSNNPVKLSAYATTTYAPSPFVFDNKLYVVFTGRDNKLYVLGTNSPLTEGAWIGYPGTSNPMNLTPAAVTFEFMPPSVAVLGDMVFLVFVGTNNSLYLLRSMKPLVAGQWLGVDGSTNPSLIPFGDNVSYNFPSMIAFQNKLILAYRTNDESNGFPVVMTGSYTPLDFSSWTSPPILFPFKFGSSNVSNVYFNIYEGDFYTTFTP